jgi:hypothetical protein
MPANMARILETSPLILGGVYVANPVTITVLAVTTGLVAAK